MPLIQLMTTILVILYMVEFVKNFLKFVKISCEKKLGYLIILAEQPSITLKSLIVNETHEGYTYRISTLIIQNSNLQS